MSVRAKFRVDEITHRVGQTTIRMSPVTGGSSENESFWKYTPSGSIELQCLNDAATKQFEPGKEFFIDFTPAEPVATS